MIDEMPYTPTAAEAKTEKLIRAAIRQIDEYYGVNGKVPTTREYDLVNRQRSLLVEKLTLMYTLRPRTWLVTNGR